MKARKDKPWVYIASPYTKGDVGINLRASIDAYNALLDTKLCVPISPLTIGFQAHLVKPRSWEEWMEADLDLVAGCDACLRLTAEWQPLNYLQSASAGADCEVMWCHSNNIRVFYELEDVVAWLEQTSREPTVPQRRLKVMAVSENTNSFGLRQMLLVADNGDAWAAHANSINLVSTGTVITTSKACPDPSSFLIRQGCELVSKLEQPVTEKLFREAWPLLPIPPLVASQRQ